METLFVLAILIVTAGILYGVFPLVFAIIRKREMSFINYALLCCAVNFAIFVICLFVPGLGNTITLCLLGTIAFTAVGRLIMNSKTRAKTVVPRVYKSRFTECPACGYIAVFEKECPKCGRLIEEPITNESVNCEQQKTYSEGIPPWTTDDFSMKWYNFLTKWLLWVSALGSLIGVVKYFTGFHYYGPWTYSAVAGDWVRVTPELIYELFGTPLRVLDIFMLFASGALAVFTIITKFKLESFKKEAPTYLYIMYIANVVINIIYLICIIAIAESTFISGMVDYVGTIAEAVFSFVCWGVFLVLNYIYFNKRKVLFKN